MASGSSGTSKPKYKIIFKKGLRGRGEKLFMMFSLAGVDYDDARIEPEDWLKVKSTLPMGAVPILEQDGQAESVAQTVPIAMYLAEEIGFLPEGSWNRLLAHSIVVSLNDMIHAFGYKRYIYTIYKALPSPGDEALNKATEECMATARQTLDYIEKFANKDSKFMFGDKILLPDIALYTDLEYCCVEQPGLREHSDWLKRWLTNFESDPKVKAYLESRPGTILGI